MCIRDSLHAGVAGGMHFQVGDHIRQVVSGIASGHIGIPQDDRTAEQRDRSHPGQDLTC